jgi:hypothetical protein
MPVGFGRVTTCSCDVNVLVLELLVVRTKPGSG